MTTLDNPSTLPDPSSVPIRPTAMRYGLIAALVLIVLSLVFNMTGMIDYSGQKGNWIPNGLNWATMIVALVMAVKHHRDNELGGYITFGRCVGLGAFMGLIIGVLTGLFALLYFGVIDTDFASTVEAQMEERFAEQGMSEDQMEMALKWSKAMISPVAMFFWSLLGSVVMMVIFSLIVGAIMKKNPPQMA